MANQEIKLSKRFQVISKKLTPGKSYKFTEAVDLLQSCPPVKFPESLDVSVMLGVDPRQSDQVVRSAVVLPHGTGKVSRVAVFAEGEAAEAAQKAGADIVGYEDLAESIKAGDMNFDVVIATPAAMRLVGQLGQILGPRGLMPNPKVGTVTPDVAGAVGRAKAGQVRYRTDKGGIIHCTIGKLNFAAKALAENLEALLADLKKNKPNSAKGVYIKKVSISSTMGPGLAIDLSTLGD